MITITQAQPGRDGGPGVTIKRVISMVGGQMVIEQSVEGGQGGAPTKQTYKKG
jgi:hypothetical protein